MSLSLSKKFRPGLFGKFLILMIATGIAISVMLNLYWRNIAQPQYRNEFHGHIEYYQTLLTKDLGDPPDKRKAEKIAQKLHIGLRYEDETLTNNNWQTNIFPQSFDERHVNKIRRGQSLAAIPIQTGRLLIYMRFRQEIELGNIFAVTGIVGLALCIAWLISRWLLSPVRELRAGMSAIESGSLDFRLQARGNDELADLGHSFNSMTQNLETMLRDRDRLLADVSHELRSPLTRMKVALELNTDKKTAKLLRSEITEMQTIITALLDTERLAAGANMEAIDIRNIAADLCREHKIFLTGDGHTLFINGSREKLKIALRNVIENAKRHGAKPVTMHCERKENSAVLRISDSGKGISQADSHKIFLPFYRAAEISKHGYGLGLYMAKKIIESMRGQIAVISVSKGAVIEIRLPVSS